MNKFFTFFGTTVPAKLKDIWSKLPPKVQQWIKGAEVAVATAVVSAFVATPASDFTTKKGIAEFVAGVGASAYAALRLYMTQSPITVLVKKTAVTKTDAIGELSKSTTVSQTITSGGPSTAAIEATQSDVESTKKS